MSEKAIVNYQPEMQEMINRLRGMISNGRKLADDQVLSLAQFAVTERLDPFAGECYLLVDNTGKTMSVMVGINGIRRKNAEQLGPDNDVMLDFVLIDPQPGARYTYECRLRDSKTTRSWTRMYKDLHDAGMPHDTIMEVIGKAPVYIGIGSFYESEKSDYKDVKFNPAEKAKKRAEAAARKLRFNLNYQFGDNGDSSIVSVLPTESGPTWTIEAETTPTTTSATVRDNGTILAELGVDPTPAPDASTDKPWTNAVITWMEASTEKSKTGEFYMDTPTDKLSFHFNALIEKLAAGGLNEKEVQIAQHKRDVIKAIIDWRNS
jgi:hypothetical protein